MTRGVIYTSRLLFLYGTATPQRIDGKYARINFYGKGEARFRLQHTRDQGGYPDELGWCDVSAMSDARVADPMSLIENVSQFGEPKRFIGSVRGGVWIDRVNGDLEVLYRRHTADWLQVIPLDVKQGDGCCHPCAAYRVAVERLDADVYP